MKFLSKKHEVLHIAILLAKYNEVKMNYRRFNTAMKQNSTIHILLSLSLLLLVGLSGCGGGSKQIKKAKAPRSGKVTVYFTKASDDLGVILIPIVRKIQEDRTAYETAMRELFLGPSLEEQEKLKLKTEIPEGCRLINVKESTKNIRIDISSQFLTGGGSESMQVRFRQLRETALNLAKGRPVFLYVDGQKAVTIGGEGLEVPQPLSRDEIGDDDVK